MGVISYNPKSAKVTEVIETQLRPPFWFITDKFGILWLGARGGVNKYDPNAMPFEHIQLSTSIIQETLGVPMDIVPGLQEVGCGVNEGKPWSAERRDNWTDGTWTPVGGESIAEFMERILVGAALALDRPGPILIVAHGQVFRTLISSIRAHLETPTPNGVPMYLEPTNDGWSLELLTP